MLTLRNTLADYDLELLQIIANRWDVDLDARDVKKAAEKLAAAMLDGEKAAREWSRLNDRERGALQIVIGSKEHKMPLAKYSRLFGDIRKMGADLRKREKPHLNPQGMAEVLYYRGLLALTYDQGKSGAQAFVFVPHDLVEALPTHETGYDLSEPDEFEETTAAVVQAPVGEPSQVHRADSSVVDDLTTILAYIQIENVVLDGNTLHAHDRQALEDYLLGSPHPARIALIAGLLKDLDLVTITDNHLKPNPNTARKWLEQTRTRQVRSLAEKWQTSTTFNELLYVPGLILEMGGWQNDPRLIRETVSAFLQSVPPDQWFSVQNLIVTIKEEEPDFQRPAADYESWYIRDAETDQYLKGYENWDRIDGAVLEVALTGAMHWLGLADLAESDTGFLLRLTAYGRAYTESGEWPDIPDPEAAITIGGDGSVFAPRTLSRYNRFQLARFTEWGAPGDQYEYRISSAGFTQAEHQNIRAEHIQTFLKRTSNDKVPPTVNKLIEQWNHTGGAPVSVRRMVVLQTETTEALDAMLSTPEIRRYLGAKLGDRAVSVRPGQWDELIAALQARGMLVEQDV